MIWGAVIGAAAATLGAAMAAREQEAAALAASLGGGFVGMRACKRDTLAEAKAKHDARMEAMHRQTMRQATVGTVLLIAFAVTAIVGVLQLGGVL